LHSNVQKNRFSRKTFLLIALLQLTVGQAIARDSGADVALPESSNTNSNINPVTNISDVYSDIDMRLRLATKTSIIACTATRCEENRAFDAQVSGIARYLSKAAIQLYPQYQNVIQRMEFSVVDKKEAGTASNNKGRIVILRGLQDLQLSEDALGFVIAREMAHVMAGHHTTNTSTKLIISALASVLFPAVAIIGASSAAAQASTATTLLTSAASTATSVVGGEVAMAKMKPTQLSQSDEIARAIMEKVEWDMRSVESVLTQDEASENPWMNDLQVSRYALQTMIEKEDAEIVLLEDENSDLTLEATGSDDEVRDDVNSEVNITPLNEASTE
jgi:hypothetical protein